eukprot:GHVT01014181.1.p1 GENE.GHVT01014181.1~~GHVT01014181.1.p1  ORF type:complete len:835 (+),score=22.53 GHVT01014181.1:738-3242(+)
MGGLPNVKAPICTRNCMLISLTVLFALAGLLLWVLTTFQAGELHRLAEHFQPKIKRTSAAGFAQLRRLLQQRETQLSAGNFVHGQEDTLTRCNGTLWHSVPLLAETKKPQITVKVNGCDDASSNLTFASAGGPGSQRNLLDRPTILEVLPAHVWGAVVFTQLRHVSLILGVRGSGFTAFSSSDNSDVDGILLDASKVLDIPCVVHCDIYITCNATEAVTHFTAPSELILKLRSPSATRTAPNSITFATPPVAHEIVPSVVFENRPFLQYVAGVDFPVQVGLDTKPVAEYAGISVEITCWWGSSSVYTRGYASRSTLALCSAPNGAVGNRPITLALRFMLYSKVAPHAGQIFYLDTQLGVDVVPEDEISHFIHVSPLVWPVILDIDPPNSKVHHAAPGNLAIVSSLPIFRKSDDGAVWYTCLWYIPDDDANGWTVFRVDPTIVSETENEWASNLECPVPNNVLYPCVARFHLVTKYIETTVISETIRFFVPLRGGWRLPLSLDINGGDELSFVSIDSLDTLAAVPIVCRLSLARQVESSSELQNVAVVDMNTCRLPGAVHCTTPNLNLIYEPNDESIFARLSLVYAKKFELSVTSEFVRVLPAPILVLADPRPLNMFHHGGFNVTIEITEVTKLVIFPERHIMCSMGGSGYYELYRKTTGSSSRVYTLPYGSYFPLSSSENSTPTIICRVDYGTKDIEIDTGGQIEVFPEFEISAAVPASGPLSGGTALALVSIIGWHRFPPSNIYCVFQNLFWTQATVVNSTNVTCPVPDMAHSTELNLRFSEVSIVEVEVRLAFKFDDLLSSGTSSVNYFVYRQVTQNLAHLAPAPKLHYTPQ